MDKELHLLIIEDREEDALLLVRELQRGGFDPIYTRVETSDTLNQALDKQQWDVIVSDYSMPKFSGPDALKIVKQRGDDIPFILSSGTIGEEKVVSAIKEGATDYIMKDNLTRLIPAIERAIRETHAHREKKKTDQEILRLKLGIEHSRDIFFMTDTRGSITYINPAFEKLYGYNQQEALGKTPRILKSGMQTPEFYKQFWDTLLSKH